MQIETTVAGLRRARQQMTGQVGLVATMGALHAGHLSLVRAARAQSAHVIATIFVNPTQFAPGEDLGCYPRTFDADRTLLESEGVDLLFAPSAEEMYPEGETTRVVVGPIADRLDGVSRPGHFTGVATIVAKLFHLALPDKAFFGQKDAAQLAILRQMVRDLNFNLQIVACPIVREADGLAMSSRNRYLSKIERQQALILSQSLAAAARLYTEGERTSARLVNGAQAVFAAAQPGVRLDYLTLIDGATLLPIPQVQPGALLAIAAVVGTTRLIDNHCF